jgi:hypothetical protein
MEIETTRKAFLYFATAAFGFIGGMLTDYWSTVNSYRNGYAAGALREPQGAKKDDFYQMGHYFGSRRVPPHFAVNITPPAIPQPPIITLKAGQTPPPTFGIEAKVEKDNQNKSGQPAEK